MIKTVFVGDKNIWSSLRKVKPDWNWQQPVERVNDFVKIIDNAHDAPDMAIADDTSIVMISDEYYRNGKAHGRTNEVNDFLRTVMECSGSSLTMIINYGSDEDKHQLERDLEDYARTHADGKCELHNYYWIDSVSPNYDIDKVIGAYLQTPDKNTEVMNAIIAD